MGYAVQRTAYPTGGTLATKNTPAPHFHMHSSHGIGKVANFCDKVLLATVHYMRIPDTFNHFGEYS